MILTHTSLRRHLYDIIDDYRRRRISYNSAAAATRVLKGPVAVQVYETINMTDAPMAVAPVTRTLERCCEVCGGASIVGISLSILLLRATVTELLLSGTMACVLVTRSRCAR